MQVHFCKQTLREKIPTCITRQHICLAVSLVLIRTLLHVGHFLSLPSFAKISPFPFYFISWIRHRTMLVSLNSDEFLLSRSFPIKKRECMLMFISFFCSHTYFTSLSHLLATNQILLHFAANLFETLTSLVSDHPALSAT